MRKVNYTKTITFVLSFIFFAACTVSLLHAQQRGGKRGTHTGSGTGAPGAGPQRVMLPPEFDNRPFDVTRPQLPPQYLGCDAELVYTRIKNGQENKRRGELHAEDKEATEQAPILPLPAALDLESTYAFRFNPAERLYEARDQILKVYCPLAEVLENGKEDRTRRGLRVKYQPRVDNRMVITDARGPKVEFEELKFREYLVTFANFREFPVESVLLPGVKQTPEKATGGGSDENLRRETITGNIHATPAEARQLEERIAVLLICKLEEPYITSETVQQKPTPDRPRDYLAQYYYLDVRLLELWFYDFDTGKILMKMKAEIK